VFNDNASEVISSYVDPAYPTAIFEVSTGGSFGAALSFTDGEFIAGDSLYLGPYTFLDPGFGGSIEYQVFGSTDTALSTWTYEIDISAQLPIAAPDSGSPLCLILLGLPALLGYGFYTRGRLASKDVAAMLSNQSEKRAP
jgi:hypothetical protein